MADWLNSCKDGRHLRPCDVVVKKGDFVGTKSFLSMKTDNNSLRTENAEPHLNAYIAYQLSKLAHYHTEGTCLHQSRPKEPYLCAQASEVAR